jgi:hypothetical protein
LKKANQTKFDSCVVHNIHGSKKHYNRSKKIL